MIPSFITIHHRHVLQHQHPYTLGALVENGSIVNAQTKKKRYILAPIMAYGKTRRSRKKDEDKDEEENQNSMNEGKNNDNDSKEEEEEEEEA